MSLKLLRLSLISWFVLVSSVAWSSDSQAGQVSAAVAANFTSALQRLAPLFEKETGHTLKPSFGSSGKLFAQVVHGAPFDVFLSADDQRSQQLIDEGYGVAGSRFVYARGRLVLWSQTPGWLAGPRTLQRQDLKRLAIAHPKAAPYGAAALEVLQSLKLYEALETKLVTGESVMQAMQFVHSGNAQLGFVAQAQVLALRPSQRGSYWLVPETLHRSISQEAVLLKRGAQNEAAHAFLNFLKSPQATALMREIGYSAGP